MSVTAVDSGNSGPARFAVSVNATVDGVAGSATSSSNGPKPIEGLIFPDWTFLPLSSIR